MTLSTTCVATSFSLSSVDSVVDGEKALLADEGRPCLMDKEPMSSSAPGRILLVDDDASSLVGKRLLTVDERFLLVAEETFWFMDADRSLLEDEDGYFPMVEETFSDEETCLVLDEEITLLVGERSHVDELRTLVVSDKISLLADRGISLLVSDERSLLADGEISLLSAEERFFRVVERVLLEDIKTEASGLAELFICVSPIVSTLAGFP